MAQATQDDVRRVAGAVVLVAGASVMFGLAGLRPFGPLQIFTAAFAMILVTVALYRLRPLLKAHGEAR